MLFSLRRGVIALALCCCSFLLAGQYALPADKLAAIPVSQLPIQNNATLLADELAARAPGRANHFAVPISTKIRPTTHGVWTEEGATSTWRVRISSPGAETLNLGFSEYNLPAGAELRILTEQERLGPFTPADNEDHNQLWTPLVEGDGLMLELKVPTASRKQVQLYLTSVNHDFVNVNKSLSGSCNLDVICSQADGWGIVDGYRDIIRSVAAYTIGGTDVCTGFLVNNVNEDGRALFMTANHCNVTATRARSLVAYWNFESPTCRQPNSTASGGNGNGRRNISNSGAELLASYAPSDVTIIEFDDPINSNANAFFAGWSAEAEVPLDTMIAIHHPGVDEKRISFSFQDPYRAAYFGAPAPDADHLEIPDWDIGTTEGGSSGSPVFDRFKHVRGQLHGGRAACGNDAFDSYGYFHTSWEGGGTPTTRIRDYLDPCGTGTLTIDGFEFSKIPTILTAASNCITTCPTTEDFRFPFSLGEGFPVGTVLSIDSNTAGISPRLSTTSAAGGERVELIVPIDAGVSSNIYTINVLAAGAEATDVITFTLFLEEEVPAAPTPVSPAEGATGVEPRASFSWEPTPRAVGYEFQLSLESDFSTFLETVTTTTRTEVAPTNALTLDQQHYWRVRTINICGPGKWAETSFFTTDVGCGRFQGRELPAEISSNGTPEVRVDVEIDNAFSVGDFEVYLDLDHTYLGDLDAKLISPSGTQVQLFNPIDDGGCPGENMSVIFTDAATLTSTDFEATCTTNAISTTGTFQPAEAFSIFNGENALGAWTLVLNDAANADGGAVTAFDILFCSDGAAQDLSVSSSVAALSVCRGDASSLVLTLGADFSGDVMLDIATERGLLDNYVTDYNAAEGTITIDFNSWARFPIGEYTLSFTVFNGSGSEREITLPLRLGIGIDEILLSEPADLAALPEGSIDFIWVAAANAISYTWEYSTTEDFATIAGAQRVTDNFVTIDNLPTGTLYWRVIGESECGTTVSAIREFTFEASGTHDFGTNRILNVYPNPVKGLLTVEATGNWPRGVNATLFDATGRQMASYQMPGAGQAAWDLGAIPAGVYYLRFTSLGTERTERLVVLP